MVDRVAGAIRGSIIIDEQTSSTSTKPSGGSGEGAGGFNDSTIPESGNVAVDNLFAYCFRIRISAAVFGASSPPRSVAWVSGVSATIETT